MRDLRGERLQIMLTPEELLAIDNFRFQFRMPTRAAAVRELLKMGLANKGIDGDGQNDPADIPRLLSIVRDPQAPPGLRLLVGERSRRLDPWIKRFAGRVANAVRARMLGDATRDSGCGLKLFSRACFLAVPQFDHMHRFLPALFLRSGWRVASVPVSHRPRRHGRSHYGVFDRGPDGHHDNRDGHERNSDGSE